MRSFDALFVVMRKSFHVMTVSMGYIVTHHIFLFEAIRWVTMIIDAIPKLGDTDVLHLVTRERDIVLSLSSQDRRYERGVGRPRGYWGFKYNKKKWCWYVSGRWPVLCIWWWSLHEKAALCRICNVSCMFAAITSLTSSSHWDHRGLCDMGERLSVPRPKYQT